jgi:hypothetical protein
LTGSKRQCCGWHNGRQAERSSKRGHLHRSLRWRFVGGEVQDECSFALWRPGCGGCPLRLAGVQQRALQAPYAAVRWLQHAHRHPSHAARPDTRRHIVTPGSSCHGLGRFPGPPFGILSPDLRPATCGLWASRAEQRRCESTREDDGGGAALPTKVKL